MPQTHINIRIRNTVAYADQAHAFLPLYSSTFRRHYRVPLVPTKARLGIAATGRQEGTQYYYTEGDPTRSPPPWTDLKAKEQGGPTGVGLHTRQDNTYRSDVLPPMATLRTPAVTGWKGLQQGTWPSTQLHSRYIPSVGTGHPKRCQGEALQVGGASPRFVGSLPRLKQELTRTF